MFNAETLIEGFTAGVMGILCTLILLIPINLIVHHLTGLPTLSAILPVLGAILLILISMALTFIAGLIPSGMAAKKDPSSPCEPNKAKTHISTTSVQTRSSLHLHGGFAL